MLENLEDNQTYTFLVKSGTDGQNGRGKYAVRGKTVDDNKWSVRGEVL